MVNYIVDSLGLVQFRLDEVIVRVIVNEKFHLAEIALAIRKQLGQLQAVGINVRVVHQGVVEI